MTALKSFGLLIVIYALGVATGAYTMQKTITKTEVQTQRVDHVVTRTVTVREPKGTVTTVVDVSRDTKAGGSRIESQTAVAPASAARRKVQMAALVGVMPRQGLTPTYGLSVSKPVLGPVTIGAWMLTNETIGLSLGVEF